MKEFPFLMYTADDSNVTVNAILKDETIWLSQKGMAELFGCSSDNISLHLKNIFSEKELLRMGKSILRNFIPWTPSYP